VEGEPDDQQHGQRALAGRGRLADRQPLGEVVQPDPDGDRHARPQGRRGGLAHGGLGGGHGPGADAGPRPGLPQPAGVQQPEQPGTEAERIDQAEPGEPAPGGLAGRGLGHGLLDRLGGMAEDVDQQEHQDAGRQGVEERPAPLAGELDPPQRQPQEDRGPGDGAEQDRLSRGHSRGSSKDRC
jgi:hypothetical protein